MKVTIFIDALLLLCVGCTTPEGNLLNQQERDQIKNDVKVVCDSMMARFERLDAAGALQYFSDSPDWNMLNADGSRWDFQATKKAWIDAMNSLTEWKWSTTRQDFIILSKDIVICTWIGKDGWSMKSGDKITYDPAAYTIVFKNIAGQWKAIYEHSSGIAVSQKPTKKRTP